MNEKIAGLVKSSDRLHAFSGELVRQGYRVVEIDLEDEALFRGRELARFNVIIYYPRFALASSHPQALRHVQDQLAEIHRRYPSIRMFPDPVLFPYYSDKVRQHYFLTSTDFPVARSYLLDSDESITRIARELGFPVVLKNRYGAGGDQVFRIDDVSALREWREVSRMRFGGSKARLWLLRKLFSRATIRGFFGERELYYPFLSAPLIAQEFIPHDTDLKVVVIDGVAMEFHWRKKAHREMWKMNIDGGAIGEWSYVPPEPLRLAERLANHLGAKWLNVDLMRKGDEWLISEFSPVWHHYRYKEYPSLVYCSDYNGPLDAEAASNLERLIVSSLDQ
jgi:hypothetical protein